MERTRPRIDGRVPRPPAPPEVAALLPDEGDPQGWVRLCELFPVRSWSDALLAAALRRMADALAPTLVGKTEDEIRAALHRGLEAAYAEALVAQDDDEAALATLDAALAESRRRADLLPERGGSGLL